MVRPAETTSPQSGDPCNGTRGTGEIASIGDGSIVINRNNNTAQTITLTNRTMYKSSKGTASRTDLKVGQRVTVVVDDSETASDILVCKVSDSAASN